MRRWSVSLPLPDDARVTLTASVSHREPTGVNLYDADRGLLATFRGPVEFRVLWPDGSERKLTLRMARGQVEDVGGVG